VWVLTRVLTLPHPEIFALTLSILAFTLSVVLDCLVFRGDNLTFKGGPNPGPRQ
jgi:hypothetical protein